MSNKLKQYFSAVWQEKEVLSEIGRDPKLSAIFDSWSPEIRRQFLDICCGVKGVKLLYDAFFKEVMNPESTPERLEEFLSLLIGTKVKILAVLPNDSTRIADEKSLLITDIVVELEDGSIANLEVQKIGYMFPGERSACYSADLLLRQYKRVRSLKKKKFSYRDIKTVYTIVLFENSPVVFHQYPDTYVHFFEAQSDSGLKLELLQKYYFIPLDIFRHIIKNRDIGNKLEAWLIFLCEDDPEEVIKLITRYPEFIPMYRQIYAMCRNVEGVMDMLFSEELLELDRNTVDLMIDEMQQEIDEKRELLAEKEQELDGMERTLAEKEQTLDGVQQTLAEKEQELDGMERTLAEKEQELDGVQQTLAEKEQELDGVQQTLAEKEQELDGMERTLAEKEQELDGVQQTLAEKEQTLAEKEQMIEWQKTQLEEAERQRKAQEEMMLQLQTALDRIAELEQKLSAQQ